MVQILRRGLAGRKFRLVPPSQTLEPHIWHLTEDQRAAIDWSRDCLLGVIDDFGELGAHEILKILDTDVVWQRKWAQVLRKPEDRERLIDSANLCAVVLRHYYDLAPQESLQKLIAAATMLITGSQYDRPDAPEDYN